MAEGCEELKVWRYGCDAWKKTKSKHKKCFGDHLIDDSDVFKKKKYKYDGD